jgi:hypothetical protein
MSDAFARSVLRVITNLVSPSPSFFSALSFQSLIRAARRYTWGEKSVSFVRYVAKGAMSDADDAKPTVDG